MESASQTWPIAIMVRFFSYTEADTNHTVRYNLTPVLNAACAVQLMGSGGRVYPINNPDTVIVIGTESMLAWWD